MKGDPLRISEKATIVAGRLPERKIRVTSTSFTEEKVILKGEVLEIRNIDGRLRIARKDRFPNAGDQPVPPYDPMGRAKPTKS